MRGPYPPHFKVSKTTPFVECRNRLESCARLRPLIHLTHFVHSIALPLGAFCKLATVFVCTKRTGLGRVRCRLF